MCDAHVIFIGSRKLNEQKKTLTCSAINMNKNNNNKSNNNNNKGLRRRRRKKSIMDDVKRAK